MSPSDPEPRDPRDTGSPSGPALDVAGVSHAFGSRQALRDVSIRMPRGGFVALIGPNGAGKTTLLSIMTRLRQVRSGAVRVFGRDLRREPSRALAELGIVFQERTLDPELSVRQNLAYHAALHGRAGRPVSGRIEALLARVGLLDRVDDKVRNLSGGEARRVEIARALVHGPRLLLLDEATAGLDPAARSGIGAIVRGLVRDEGLSVLWATHLFDEIRPDDEVVVLHRGRVRAAGLSRDIAAGAPGASLAGAFDRLTASEQSPA